MNLVRERRLCTEVYKTLNSLNPRFMQELFKLRETNRNVRKKYKLNSNISVVNQVNYGTKYLKAFEKINSNWNGWGCWTKISLSAYGRGTCRIDSQQQGIKLRF